MLFQRRRIATGEDIGAPVSRLPGDLPATLSISGLADLDQVLTGDLAAAYAGQGFFVVVPPPPVPVDVARLWARLALAGAGLLEAVEAAVAEADAITRIYWTDAARFRRDSALLATVAGGLGLDDAALDELFRSAVALAVAAGAEP